MSLRSQARDFAEEQVRNAAASLGQAAIAGIERRLQWRWDNAPLLFKEADRMVWLLATDRGFVPFRKARLATWKNRRRKFAAKAWAQDPAFAERCGICREGDA